jgi:hypothetical protein
MHQNIQAIIVLAAKQTWGLSAKFPPHPVKSGFVFLSLSLQALHSGKFLPSESM